MTMEQEGKNGETFDEELYVKRIPLQKGDAISNPYYGSTMPNCGSFTP